LVPAEASPFYVAGGTLAPDAPSYVRRLADEKLHEALARGAFCYVLTSWQMGKSSLMVRAASRLRGDGVTTVALDLTAFGQNINAEQWYYGLLTTIGDRLDLEDDLEAFWDANERLGPLHRWMEALRQVVLRGRESPVVVFVDEIDVVQSLPFSTDEFFAAIRECYTRRATDSDYHRLTFCLVGVATPTDLIRDTRLTPFNIGTRIDVLDFTDREIVRFADGLGPDSAANDATVRRIAHWTNGHPYLTQCLCGAIVEHAGAAGVDDVDRLCDDIFFSHRARDPDPNLAFVAAQLFGRAENVGALLALYRQVRSGQSVRDDERDPLVAALRLSGVVRVEEGFLRVRNRIYERVFDVEWVDANMPDAELERQKEANRVLRELYEEAEGERQRTRVLLSQLQMRRGQDELTGNRATGLLDLIDAWGAVKDDPTEARLCAAVCGMARCSSPGTTACFGLASRTNGGISAA
jgi:hypothetical protein